MGRYGKAKKCRYMDCGGLDHRYNHILGMEIDWGRNTILAFFTTRVPVHDDGIFLSMADVVFIVSKGPRHDHKAGGGSGPCSGLFLDPYDFFAGGFYWCLFLVPDFAGEMDGQEDAAAYGGLLELPFRFCHDGTGLLPAFPGRARGHREIACLGIGYRIGLIVLGSP